MSKEILTSVNGQLRVDVGDRSYLFDPQTIFENADKSFSIEHVRDGLYSIIHKGSSISAVVDHVEPNRIHITVGGSVYPLHLVDHRLQLLETYGSEQSEENHDSQIRAPMPGLVLKLQVEAGSLVSRNDPLLVLEAMKMENEIRAPGDGIVSTIYVRAGDAVLKNAPLIELTPVPSTV